ncbi:MAG: thioredoxin family protein [Candidatus Glassbacteria bacterium]
MKAILILAAAFGVLALASVSYTVAADANSPAVAKAPDFTAIDYKGENIKLSDYHGKVVVLEWLNPDCPFVQRHYREGTFKKLAEKYGSEGLVWLAVNSTSTQDAARSADWAKQNGLPYPIIVDEDGHVAKLFGAKTTPHLFVIGRNGELVYQGAVDDDPNGDKKQRNVYVASAIEAALTGKLPATRETKSYGCSVKYRN